MKNLLFRWPVASIAIALVFSIAACEAVKNEEIAPQIGASAPSNTTIGTNSTTSLPSISTSSPYTVSLESITNNGNGTYTWIWSVQNPNPGNGSNGTVQDLSHWNITLGQCATMADIVSGAMSGDGLNWTNITPLNRIDPSQDCYTDSVIKFDMGTSGNRKSYYQLTVNQNFDIDTEVTGVYKSGRETGCGVFLFSGFGCPIVEENSCSLSQGYYFAKPNLVWAGTVTIGGYTYTQAEGQAIWNTSNRGGIKDAKKGFLQVAAIKLSGSSVGPSASVWADVTIVENYLAGLGKLSPINLPTGNAAAKAAAGRIGEWIDNNHCEDE